ncbi:DUF4157 domain-containing protein [Kordia sp. YSTF-M3]|uniref:DUF4157 domain-containing protein n=1 Tax=Kordia aestuariivivens TaxID=2759037 RepID=A0ABR7Q6Y4_9FLAO|nr:DUF4157 domain-containing protein [Kordia aestuariivivens]MBC8754331.1 DUF4157 domain-containing protein [Kordia aestuariivivens]
MKTHLTKKLGGKKQQTAAAHSTKNSGFSLEDNRTSTIVQQKQIDAIQSPIQKKKNNTGLPDTLKSGMENLSGHSMDDVKVHYNSSKPAQLNAHAYAQGTNIHLASGQEKHLPHEAWHVVQQKQGRVKPTIKTKGVAINDDKGLEKEADVMGAKALQRKEISNSSIQLKEVAQRKLQKVVENTSSGTIQKMSNSVIQFAEPQDTVEVIKKYFYNTYQHYGKALIERVCTAKGMRVHAHGSGKPGDGINAATQKEMDDLLPFLRAAKRAAPRRQAPAKKKPRDKSKVHNKVEAKAAALSKEQKKKDRAAAKKAAYDARQ